MSNLYAIQLRRELLNFRRTCIVVDAYHMGIKGRQQNTLQWEKGSNVRLFETNENEAIDSPMFRRNETKMPHCKIYDAVIEVTEK